VCQDRARGNGSLWEPGELAYQQKLEKTDKAAFIALLEVIHLLVLSLC
jgi:hypothetical protein